MSYRRLTGACLISGILLVSSLISGCSPAGGGAIALNLPEIGQSPAASQAQNGGSDEFETIRQAADAYVNSGQALTISAKNIYDSMVAVSPKLVWIIRGNESMAPFEVQYYDPYNYNKGPFIIDVRPKEPEMPNPFSKGHVPGSLHISWRQLTLYKNFVNMPRQRQIVVVSSTGEAGAQVAAILRVMGYEAVALEWGMASWAGATDSLTSYDKSRDTVSDWGTDYTSGSTPEPTETYALPVVDNTESTDKAIVLLAAASAYLTSEARRSDMKASDLYQALNFEPNTAAQIFLSTFFTGSTTGNPYTQPFILDIRDTAAFNQGHLSGALNVYLKDVFETENLERLPPDRQILVYGDNGHESSAVTALLNLLGYHARNLRWGMAADQFVPTRDCMNYQVVTGLNSFVCTS